MVVNISPQTPPPSGPGDWVSRCQGWIVPDWNGRFSLHVEINPVLQKVSEYYMIRKYPNHILQTNPRHCEEEPHTFIVLLFVYIDLRQLNIQ